MQAVLVVEHDIPLADQLNHTLTKQSYFVNVCHLLSSSFKKIEQRAFDIVIVSNTLQDGQGSDLIGHLHRASFATRTIMLAKRLTYQDRITAYKNGVDDIVFKPFNLNEFWWRFQVVARRRKVQHRYALQLCDGVNVYPEEGLLETTTKTERLRKRESQILSCLIQHRNRVVGRDELTSWVWRYDGFMPKDITLDVYIKRVRMRLGEYSSYLETVRGFGYRIRDQAGAC